MPRRTAGSRIWWLAALLAVCPAPLGAQGGAATEDEAPDSTHPSLRVGGIVLEFPVKVHMDWRHFDRPAAGVDPDALDLRRTRVAITGTAFKRIHFEVERELLDAEQGWRDVYLDLDLGRRLEVKAGRFKMPFSLEQLTSVTRLAFAYRSLAATYLAPGREVGMMAHGTVARGVKYQAGVFRRGGDNVRSSERRDPRGAPAAAGRLTVRPWTRRGASPALRGLTVGAAFTAGNVPEGLNSLRGHTIADEAFVPLTYVSGLRRRFGAEVEWKAGRASIQSEVMRVSDQRRGLGTDDQNLPAVGAHGWYLAGTWLLIGKKEANPGAVELAARLERFQMGGGNREGPAATAPRAFGLPEQADEVWTVGASWQTHRFVRLRANAIHERREQDRVGVVGQEDMWSAIVRLQVSL